jgi:hypothetical protein
VVAGVVVMAIALPPADRRTAALQDNRVFRRTFEAEDSSFFIGKIPGIKK